MKKKANGLSLMMDQPYWGVLTLLALVLLTTTLQADEKWSFFPREAGVIPINGDDVIENPVALRIKERLSVKAANWVFEVGDSIAFVDDVKGYETKHIDWAVPYAKRIRVLAFGCPRGALRTILELRQRSDFEFTIVPQPFMLNYSKYRYPSIKKYFAERSQTALAKDYDVILLFSSDFLIMKDDQTPKRIVAKIKAGLPAVCVLNGGNWYQKDFQPERVLFEDISPLRYAKGKAPIQPLKRTETESPITAASSYLLWPPVGGFKVKPAPLSDVLVTNGEDAALATGKYGSSRVVGINVKHPQGGFETGSRIETGGKPVPEDYYETRYSQILKALTWAAGQTPDVALRIPREYPATVGRETTVVLPIKRVAGDLTKINLRYRFQDPWGIEIASGQQKVDLSSSMMNLELTLPPPRINGVHRLDLWLKSKGKVVNWGHAAVKAIGGVALKVEEIQRAVKQGGKAVYQLNTGGCTGMLRVWGVDDLDRVFVDFTRPFKDGDKVEIDTTFSQRPYNRLFFDLRDDKGLLFGRELRELYVPRIGLDSLDGQFSVMCYARPWAPPHLIRYLGDLYQAAGFNTMHYHWHNRQRVWETASMGLPGVTALIIPSIKQRNFDRELKNCPNKPETRRKWSQGITQAVDDIKTYGSAFRLIDDEAYLAYCGYHDGEFQGAQACQCKHCLKLFHRKMKEQYQEIAKLNKAWGVNYPDFDSVKVMEEQDIPSDNPTGWLEFRQFMNKVFAENYYGWVAEQHRPIGYSFLVGPGAPNFGTKDGGPTYKGGDYSQLKNGLRFMMAYGGPESEVFDDMFVGQPGAQKYDPPLWWREWGPWHHLLKGADALWFYSGNSIIGNEIAWRKHAAWVAEGVGDIVRGCGALLRDAKPLKKQVRILYSPENLAMGWLFGKRLDAWRGFRLKNGSDSCTQTLTELFKNFFNIQPSLIMAEDLKNGGLKDCQLLILPAAFNLDDETAAAIKKYVSDGGFVLADVLPGTRNRYGKPRDASVLADLFGVDASRAELHQEPEAWYSACNNPDPAFCQDLIWLPAQMTFRHIKPTTAKVLGKMLSKEKKESTTFFMNDYGSGKALLLNFVPCNLNTETSGWWRMFGQALLNVANVKPSARIVDPLTNEILPYRPLYAFQYGKALLLGALRGRSTWTGGGPIMIDDAAAFDLRQKAKFVWDGPKHAYDVRQGKYLGLTESVIVDLKSFKAKLLALLPYKVTDLALKVPERVKGGQTATIAATIKTDGETPGDHLFYLELFSPTGVRIPHYCRTRPAPRGSGEFKINFAYNERPGKWRIVVRDVISGLRKESFVEVLPVERAL